MCVCERERERAELSVQALEKRLRDHLGVRGLLTRADSLVGAVTISGDHKERTVAWLRTMGF